MVKEIGTSSTILVTMCEIRYCLVTGMLTFLVSTVGSAAERLSAMNAARSVDQRAQPMFEFAPKANEDVCFDLVEHDKIAFGQPFNVTLQIQVSFKISDF